ncbi:MAG: polysaccharide deacetylase family protein [Vicinamibacterales bacterium]
MIAIRHAVKTLVFRSGGHAARLRAAPPPGLAVLCYHSVRAPGDSGVPFAELHVRADRLAAHCRFLAEACAPVSLADVEASLAGGTALPPAAVLVTFDDGCRSVLTRALPILERYRVPALVFACSGTIERQELAWYDALARRSGEAGVAATKYLPYDQWIAAVAEVTAPASPDDPHGPLTVAELQQLAAHPLVTIGAHTVNHPILASAPRQVQREEIAASRRALAAWTGQPIDAFAYPNGIPGVDYTPQAVDLVREAGFRVAFSTRPAFATPGVERFEQPRFVMLDMPAAELAHRLAFSWPRPA